MVNIRLATGRQKFLSQGQSLNFHIPDNDNTEELLAKVMTSVLKISQTTCTCRYNRRMYRFHAGVQYSTFSNWKQWK